MRFEMKDESESFLRCQLKNVDVSIINEFKSILNQNGCWESVVASIPASFSKLISERLIKDKAKLYNETPADVLLNELRKRNTRVSDVIPWLEDASLELDQALMLFKPDEPLEIIEEPRKTFNAEKQIRLTCKAKGFPTPKYQWYKDDDELVTQIFSELTILNITLNDEGVYRCKVYNYDRLTNDPINSLLSRESIVIVNDDNLLPISDLRIISHPVSPASRINQGANTSLVCKAESPNPIISYQWYENGYQMLGETKPELWLSKISPRNGISKWIYSCLVSDGKTSVWSNKAKIFLNIPTPETQYYAKRKIALLFGNQVYQQLDQLKLSTFDVITLSEILKSKGFEIFAYKNLTLTEMKSAVEMFISLIEDGDYVVFYYGGHGFEELNLHYMIPVEANEAFLPSDSLSVETVLEKLQIRTPALILLLIDMCRVNPKRTEPMIRTSNKTVITVKDSNVLIAYSTSPNTCAFEDKTGENGYFVHHLKKYLTQKLDIIEILNRVKGSMSLKTQSPWTSGNLSKKLCLDDPCLTKDNNQIFSELDEIKICFNSDLQERLLEFKDFKCDVLLQLYRHEKTFLNAIDLVLKIPNYNKIEPSFVIDVDLEINSKKNNPSIQLNDNNCQLNDRKSYTIKNIQKLRSDLIVVIILISKFKNVDPEKKVENLGMPLIARNYFWKNQIDG